MPSLVQEEGSSRRRAREPDSDPLLGTSGRRLWCKRLLWIVYVVVLLEVASRMRFVIAMGTPFFLSDVRLAYYPELRSITERETPVSSVDPTVDVLLLGGSVLHDDFGDIGARLRAALEASSGREVVVHNAAWPAHMFLDSLYKYQLLEEHRFDLVIVYHGINDSRMNACQEEVFRDDYTHSSYYGRIVASDSHPELPYLTFPYSLRCAWMEVVEKLAWEKTIDRGILTDELLELPDRVRTLPCVESSLRRLCELARERSDAVFLLTFGSHLPAGYDFDLRSDEQPAGVNDYAGGGSGQIEQWGLASVALEAIRLHNAVVRRVARSQPDVHLVDMAARLDGPGSRFADVCHLSAEGRELFVDVLTPELIPELEAD